MLDTTSIDIEECESILNRHLTPVAADLKLLDLTQLLELVASDRIDNIASVVDGSCELYFKENSLSFYNVGEFAIDWGKSPLIRLDMKLHLDGVSALFRLVLDGPLPCVEITYIAFDDVAMSSARKSRHLAKALSEARIRRSPGIGARSA